MQTADLDRLARMRKERKSQEVDYTLRGVPRKPAPSAPSTVTVDSSPARYFSVDGTFLEGLGVGEAEAGDGSGGSPGGARKGVVGEVSENSGEP